MLSIDHYAYTNRLRQVDPVVKAGLASSVLLLCLALSRPAVGILATLWMWGLSICLAGLPAAVFGRLLIAEGTFMLITVVGVALSVSTSPVLGEDSWSWQIGPLWVSSSPAMIQLALTLLTRALGGAAALNFLALTTPMVDVIELLRRLHVPALLIDLMTITYRYIFILLENLERMVTAQSSRLGYANLRRSMVSAGLLASRLFIETYQRSQRLQTALDSRGYSGAGNLKVLPLNFRFDFPLVGLGMLALISLVLVKLYV